VFEKHHDEARQISYYLKQIEMLEEQVAKRAQARTIFGLDENTNVDPWPDETTFMFKRNFGKSQSRQYSYCAHKAGYYWYVTGRKVEGYQIKFWDLLWNFLVPAWEETGEVWLATEWTYITEVTADEN